LLARTTALPSNNHFWKPSSEVTFKALQPGEPFLFKLHAPRNFIAGGGFFAKFLTLPVNLAWEAFGESNGARSLAEVKETIGKYRRSSIGPHDNPDIGCIVLVEPFFFAEDEWIQCPSDSALNTVIGKCYDMDSLLMRLEVAALLVLLVPTRGPGSSARYTIPAS
jgi:putative restriction endonuclease